LGGGDEDLADEVLLNPSLGYSIDRRDSPLKPTRGEFFWIDVQANRLVRGGNVTYYQLRNDVRFFRSPMRYTVLALHSNLAYQFGEFPSYIRFGMGGAR
jgi:outer membrane protein assembly factor BamA